MHKPGVLIRPIISYSGLWLVKAYVKDENNNAKNSINFSNYIRNVPIEDDEIMASFDVTFLYINIPIMDTLKMVKDYINNGGQFAKK